MSEHHEGMCIHFGSAIVTLGGTIRYIVVRGKKRYFEMHRYFGPMPTRKNGEPLATRWPAYVWDAVQAWIDAGKPMKGDECIWP